MTSERIRVLRLIARLNVGGPAIQATLLAERLDAARFESRLVTGSEAAAEGNLLALRGGRVDALATVPELGREIHPVRDAIALCRLVRLIRDFRPHIVHTHTAKAGTLGRLAARLAGTPVIVHTYHGHVFRGYFSPARTRFFIALEAGLARMTDRILTVSERVRREILDFGVGRPEQISVLPLGLDLAALITSKTGAGALHRELGLPSAAPLVGIVARLVPIKRHDVFLAAAERIAKSCPTCHFVIVGDGERRASLEALARRSPIPDRVHFLGWRADLADIYADLDVVILCSDNEGTPVSLIEAMAVSRPVVSTRVGGVPDIVDDGITGLLVPAADAGALAGAVCALLADPARRMRMGQEGRRRAVSAFTAERLVADIERLYSELLAAKSVRV